MLPAPQMPPVPLMQPRHHLPVPLTPPTHHLPVPLTPPMPPVPQMQPTHHLPVPLTLPPHPASSDSFLFFSAQPFSLPFPDIPGSISASASCLPGR